MLKKWLSYINLARNKRSDMFIGHVPHYWKPVSTKPNEWGGVNYKYKALPGQLVMALDQKDGKATPL